VKLVVIYGPPGVGKLTTARALAKLTGFRLFHNHLSFDLVKAVFDFPTRPFLQLLETIRLAAFEAAVREELPGLIFTFVYAAPEDDGFVQKMVRSVESLGGELVFVRLTCDAAVHERRVAGEERRGLGKIATVEALRRMLARSNLTAPVPLRSSLEIDNSTLEPDVVAARIAQHFALPRR
jgi:hypothetical protein